MPPIGAHKNSQTSVLSAATGSQTWQPCTLTWYDPALGGTNSSSGRANPNAATASGEAYDPNADTCAAPPQYSFGTMITFRYGGNSVTCRVNDRGGAIQGSHFDLSRHAANALGMLSGGVVAASFAVGGNASSPAGQQTGASPGAGGSSGAGSGNIIGIVSDLLTLNLSDMAARLALVGVTVIKDVSIGIGDYVIRPAWHWNQRAVMYYQQNVLFGKDPYPQMWTAAFWAFGYWLLWTDPTKPGLKPAPVRNSRIGRHVRSAQGIPARMSLIKPKDVRDRTPKKPKPHVSSVTVAQVGTMGTDRPQRVKVRGNINGSGNVGEGVPTERIGEARGTSREARRGQAPRYREAAASLHAESPESHAADRTGNRSSSTRERTSQGASNESIGGRIAARHRRTS